LKLLEEENTKYKSKLADQKSKSIETDNDSYDPKIVECKK